MMVGPYGLGHDGLGHDGLGHDGLGHDGLGHDGVEAWIPGTGTDSDLASLSLASRLNPSNPAIISNTSTVFYFQYLASRQRASIARYIHLPIQAFRRDRMLFSFSLKTSE